MDEPTTLTELLALDDMTRHFSWLGLSGALLPPEDSLRYLRDSIERAQMVAEVPENVRENFERVRKTFLYGLVEFDMFTVAADDARLILEGALRVRFVTYYDGKLPVTKKAEETTLSASSFDDVRQLAKRGYQLVTADGPSRLPLGMSGLLSWARGERLLVGQRSAAGDRTTADLRNHAAHPSGFHRLGPPETARALCRVAEFINKLWGADTPGGQTFPAPVERVPRVAAMSVDGTRFVTFSSVRSLRAGDPAFEDGTFAVYLASPTEDLCGIGGSRLGFSYRPGFQCTSLPCELLWGPGPLDELLPELDRYEDHAFNDQVQHLDRLFVVRTDGDETDPPRSPADFFASAEIEGIWHVVRADYPNDARRHVHEHRDKAPSDLKGGRCPDCPVTELGRFYDRASTDKCLAQHTGQ